MAVRTRLRTRRTVFRAITAHKIQLYSDIKTELYQAVTMFLFSLVKVKKKVIYLSEGAIKFSVLLL